MTSNHAIGVIAKFLAFLQNRRSVLVATTNSSANFLVNLEEQYFADVLVI